MNECENRNNYTKNIFIQISRLTLIAKTINFKISVSYQLHMINNVKGSAHYSKRIIRKKRLFCFVLWGCRIVWCTLTSWYLVSLLPVSIIHVSDIFLVGFWSWGISFIMWGAGAGAGRRPGLGFWFPVKWWDPRPHRVTWSQPINMHPVESPRESWKARGRLSLNKSPRCLYQ